MKLKIIIIIDLIILLILLTPAVFATETPMIYYRFEDDLTDEGDGSLGYTLTPTNGPIYAIGKLDKAINFTAGSSQDAYKDDCSGDELTKIRTIDFWFKPKSIDTSTFLVSVGDTGDRLAIRTANARVDVELIVSSSAKFEFSAVTPLEVGVWMQIVVVMGTGGAKLYINGNTTPEATHGSTDVLPSSIDDILLGRYFGGSYYANGLIDNIAFFDEEYTTGDVTYSWNSGDGRNFLGAPADTTPPVIALNEPANNTWYTSKTILFNATATDATGFTNCSLWTNETAWGFKEANTTAIVNDTKFSISETFTNDGYYLWNIECCDSVATPNCGFNDTNFTVKIDSTKPNVTLNSPADNANLTVEDTTKNVTFNCSATDAVGLTNITLYHDVSSWSANETNTVAGIDNSTTFNNLIPDGTYIWNCYACDTSSNCDFAPANFTLNIVLKERFIIDIEDYGIEWVKLNWT